MVHYQQKEAFITSYHFLIPEFILAAQQKVGTCDCRQTEKASRVMQQQYDNQPTVRTTISQQLTHIGTTIN